MLLCTVYIIGESVFVLTAEGGKPFLMGLLQSRAKPNKSGGISPWECPEALLLSRLSYLKSRGVREANKSID